MKINKIEGTGEQETKETQGTNLEFGKIVEGTRELTNEKLTIKYYLVHDFGYLKIVKDDNERFYLIDTDKNIILGNKAYISEGIEAKDYIYFRYSDKFDGEIKIHELSKKSLGIKC